MKEPIEFPVIFTPKGAAFSSKHGSSSVNAAALASLS